MKFNLKRPCSNCPFRKKGAIDLRPGRVEGIIKNLDNDYNTFPCHKTLDGEETEGAYTYTGNESACIGAIAYKLKYDGQLSVMTRIAVLRKEIRLATIEEVYPLLIDPPCDTSS